ncbi:hypothetical protein HK100_006577 [Physocladia obscura]|uniref:Uncharacterized protein n=1 Tax=Physocladia obscura TaxID=109957 RepID=A0AAD5SQF9_9FUNG|nr:hypothetical protein HK100_006577 [Physocladia obscura]
MDETKSSNGNGSSSTFSRRMLRERTSSMAAQVQVADPDAITYSHVQHIQSKQYLHNLEAIMGNIDTIEQSVTSPVAESESFSSLTSNSLLSNSLLSPISTASFSPPTNPNTPIIPSRNQQTVGILHPPFKLNNSFYDGRRRQHSDPSSTGTTPSLSRPPASVLKLRPSAPLQASSTVSIISAPIHFAHIQPQFSSSTDIRRKSSIVSESDTSLTALPSSSTPINLLSRPFSPPSALDRLSPSIMQQQTIYSPPTSPLPPNIPTAPGMNRSRSLQSQGFGGRRSSTTRSEGDVSDGSGHSNLARFRAKRAAEKATEKAEKARLAQISLQQLQQEKTISNEE